MLSSVVAFKLVSVVGCLLTILSTSSEATEASLSVTEHLGTAGLVGSVAAPADSLAKLAPIPAASRQAEVVEVSSSGLTYGWWVVVGVIAAEPFDDTAAARIHSRIERCGYKAFNDFSVKFAGFAPGLTVFVLGAYASKGEANATLFKAKMCVPDAYIKYGRYLGE